MDTPALYTKTLRLLGGDNPYGEPNFILHWGNNPLRRKRGEPQRLLPGQSLPYWALMMWYPPDEYGSPMMWPPDSGPYPTYGRYEAVQTFRRDGEPARLDSAALNLRVLSYMIWTVKRRMHDRLVKRHAAWREIQAEKSRQRMNLIADCLKGSSPRFTDAVSYCGQKNVKSEVQRRMEIIEENERQLRRQAALMPRGLTQG